MCSALKNLDDTYVIEAYPYNDSTGNGGVSTKIEEDFTVFIVVISLLSVLLLILAGNWINSFNFLQYSIKINNLFG